MGMNLAGVKKVLDLERRIARLEADNRELRDELRRRELEHERAVAEVHRSYKREIILLPRGELTHTGRDRKG
jgi:MerR family transcriptional regulator/heat shock protein HspR